MKTVRRRKLKTSTVKERMVKRRCIYDVTNFAFLLCQKRPTNKVYEDDNERF